VGLRPGEKLYEELLISGKENLTSNNKILISKESFLNKALLDEVLESLSIAERKLNISKAIEILENSVEGYKHDRGDL
jgi:FlaA1/EpsC-like NDP-sugar epimerase